MTPAITQLKRAGVAYRLHEYRHDPAAASYGLEAAEALGLAPERVFKTLIAELIGPAGGLASVVVPVVARLDLKALAQAAGAKRAEMANPAQAERATGYVVGGISPLGQKRRLALWLDSSALGFDTIYVSGGRRGLEIELPPSALLELNSGHAAAVAR
jgi:Cys-tRNA(Pro)/Cys-tRNA(Cys) deacylase